MIIHASVHAQLLLAMYSHFFGALDKNGKVSIKVFDDEGKEVNPLLVRTEGHRCHKQVKS